MRKEKENREKKEKNGKNKISRKVWAVPWQAGAAGRAPVPVGRGRARSLPQRLLHTRVPWVPPPAAFPGAPRGPGQTARRAR